MTGPYFRGRSGGKHYYIGLAEGIKYAHPELRGARIFEQLEALDLMEEFMAGSTPFGLPYSFSSYELEIDREH